MNSPFHKRHFAGNSCRGHAFKDCKLYLNPALALRISLAFETTYRVGVGNLHSTAKFARMGELGAGLKGS